MPAKPASCPPSLVARAALPRTGFFIGACRGKDGGEAAFVPPPRALESALRCQYNVVVASELRFEWDARKNRANVRLHGVSFGEASSAFLDEYAILIDDPDHSSDEERFVLLGLSSTLRLLVVCHCYRRKADIVRIISAWKADRREHQDYFGRFKK